jgi:outer membrane protein insertion porin family
MLIKSIEYKGMVHISKSVAKRMLKFEVGDDISEKNVDEALKKYFSQGYFRDAWVEYEDGVLTFNFTEKPIISQVVLKGWKENDEDEIKSTIVQIKKGSLYDEKKLEAAKKRIVSAISQEGKIDTVVEIEKEYLENGSIKVTFVINEGETIVIEKLRYHGVHGVDSEDFDDVIANKEHQWAGWFFGRNNGEMQLADLEYDNLRIRDYYMQFGYLDSKVEPPFVRVNFDSYTADMSYDIKEGPVYKINSISIVQTKHVIDDAKAMSVVSLKKGEVFNIKTFREDAEEIKTIVADLSYAFAQVVPDLKKNKENNTVDVVFKVIPGDKVKIRNVVISGNTRTLDRIVRRELYLGPGDMYSLTDLKDSRNALGRLGYFDSNAIEEKRINNQTIDLIVKVKEAATGNIQIGGGYGSYGGLLVSLGISDNNVWGSGIGVALNLEMSQMTQNATFSISNPRLNDSDFSGNFSVNYSSIEYNDYSVETMGFGTGVGYRFTRHLSGYIGYNFSSNDYSDAPNYEEYLQDRIDNGYDNTDALSRDEYEANIETYTKSAPIVSVKYDDTDDYYLPREGITASQSVEFAGAGGDAEFIKTRTNFAIFRSLEKYVGFDVIARYKARYYHLVDDGYIPLAERFYMGGIGSVRGYESYSISPTAQGTDDFRIGGLMTFSNNVELSFPLIPKAKMRLVTFYDYGMIGEDSLSEMKRAGYGVGIEWFSPVGPVQIVFANPLMDEDGDRTSKFEFTMGQRF